MELTEVHRIGYDSFSIGMTYAAVLATKMKWDRTKDKDVCHAPKSHIKYMGTLVNHWIEGSGDGRRPFYVFDLHGKTLTLEGECTTCFVENADEKDYPVVSTPIDSYITVA
jgi:hypothetical protein